ncbi:MAG: hypothetical protein CVT83_08570 [Alphaproteobacteria bacterium HGW-Alphaproteobacteria-5]|nr:MAG: hypothetical protein CVT83_08570 [Alphaproteobacteria bacterium HGW-Alphaproteobacteria-5]
MKSNVKCWTPQAAVLGIAMLWLSACAMAGTDTWAPCPPVVEYSAADQTRAAIEVAALPKGAVIIRMLGDHAVLRDQARACR